MAVRFSDVIEAALREARARAATPRPTLDDEASEAGRAATGNEAVSPPTDPSGDAAAQPRAESFE